VTRRPLVLISAHTEKRGSELPDAGVSLSHRYSDALAAAGAIPMVLPCTAEPGVIRDAVVATHGILLSGGDDVHPAYYARRLPPEVRARVYPAQGVRDLFEFLLIDEVFRQRKPLLAICRGHQLLNVALGGTLVADLPLQRPTTHGHNRQKQRFEPVHEVNVEPGSLLARVTGRERLQVNSTHHQAVDRVAGALRITGRSTDGVVEAMELGDPAPDALPFLLSVQFHPERLCDRYPEHARLFSAFVDACGGAG
jgi:putative glutamine amidotransferase